MMHICGTRQCWKFPQVHRSEAGNFGGGSGTFCWFFFDLVFMTWDSRQEGLKLFDWVSNTGTRGRWDKGWNIPWVLGKNHCTWCLGSLCHQAIYNHCIDYVGSHITVFLEKEFQLHLPSANWYIQPITWQSANYYDNVYTYWLRVDINFFR